VHGFATSGSGRVVNFTTALVLSKNANGLVGHWPAGVPVCAVDVPLDALPRDGVDVGDVDGVLVVPNGREVGAELHVLVVGQSGRSSERGLSARRIAGRGAALRGDGKQTLLEGLGRTSTPFPPEKVRALYPDHATWLATYRAATEHLVETGVFLADDAEEIVARASTLELPI
jgi:hypothetical protein